MQQAGIPQAEGLTFFIHHSSHRVNMRNLPVILLFVLSLIGCAPTTPSLTMDRQAINSKKWNIAVLDLHYEYEGKGMIGITAYESAGRDGGRVVAGLLAAELATIPQFDVVERGMIEKVLAEQSLQMTGAVSSQSAVKLGRLVGANAIIVGEMTDYVYWNNIAGFGSTVSYSIRMIDAEDGRILMSTTISRARGFVEPLTNASLTAKEVVAQVAQKMP